MLEELEVIIEDEVVVEAVAQEYGREIPNANDQVEARTNAWQCNLFKELIQHK